MKWRLAALVVSGLALMAAMPAMAQQAHPGGAPDKADAHVAQLYALVKQVHQVGLANADHAAVMARLKTIADAHAAETGADPVQMEAHIQQMAHQAVMAADTNPHILDTLDTFWTALHADGAPAAHAAHPASGPDATTRSLQGDASWRTDAHMKEFYDLSVATLGSGKPVDRAAYEAKSQAIFADFAKAQGMDPKAMQDHLKAIPGQMIQIAKDDPKVLKSQDAFIVALFGPE